MQLSTTFFIAGYEATETLGVVRGNVVRTKNIGADIVAGLRNIVGGEVPEYTSLLAGARDQAIDRMVEDARKLNADGIIGIDFATSQVMQGAAELLVYGTAVRLRRSG